MICRKQSSLKKGVNIWQVVNENEQLPSYLAKICDVLLLLRRPSSAQYAKRLKNVALSLLISNSTILQAKSDGIGAAGTKIFREIFFQNSIGIVIMQKLHSNSAHIRFFYFTIFPFF